MLFSFYTYHQKCSVDVLVYLESKPWSNPKNDECVIFLWYAIHFSYLLFVGVWQISCICGMNGEEANKTDILAIYKSQEFEQFYNGPWIMMNDKWVVFLPKTNVAEQVVWLSFSLIVLIYSDSWQGQPRLSPLPLRLSPTPHVYEYIERGRTPWGQPKVSLLIK